MNIVNGNIQFLEIKSRGRCQIKWDRMINHLESIVILQLR
jgi:hypothetical protein